VDHLLTTPTSNDKLEGIVRKDESLNAIRKVQALRWLRSRLAVTDGRAAVVFAGISGDALTRGELYKNVKNVKCPPRVAERVAKSIAEWKEPIGQDLLNRAVSVFVKPALPTKRYTTAFRAVVATVGVAPTDPDMLMVLGEGNYRVGQFKEAVKNLSRSAELILATTGCTNRSEWAFIAMAQFKLGRPDEARRGLAKMRASKDPPGCLRPAYPGYLSYPALEAEAISLIEPASICPPSKPASSTPSKAAPAAAPSSR
jgi:hypothetical protein